MGDGLTSEKQRLMWRIVGFVIALVVVIVFHQRLIALASLKASCDPPLQYVQSSNGTWECV
jgi:hypothetical protein